MPKEKARHQKPRFWLNSLGGLIVWAYTQRHATCDYASSATLAVDLLAILT